MKNPSRRNELRVWLDKEKYLQAVLQQLRKDLNAVALEFPFDNISETPYETMFTHLRNILSTLTSESPEKLKALLYRVDIPESRIHQEMKDRDITDWEAVLTDLLLERELEKVFWRERFGRGK